MERGGRCTTLPEVCEKMWFVEKGEQENAKEEGSEKRPRNERKSPKEGRKPEEGKKTRTARVII